MPPNPAPHITGHLLEIGLVEANGMGAAPLSWREIVAWQTATAIRLPPWEAQLIRRLSTAYVAEGRRAEDDNCPPPWGETNRLIAIETEATQLRSLLG